MAAYSGTRQGGVCCLSDRWLCVIRTHEFGKVAPGWRLEKLEKQVSNVEFIAFVEETEQVNNMIL